MRILQGDGHLKYMIPYQNYSRGQPNIKSTKGPIYIGLLSIPMAIVNQAMYTER
jgi:hypothetical protein